MTTHNLGASCYVQAYPVFGPELILTSRSEQTGKRFDSTRFRETAVFDFAGDRLWVESENSALIGRGESEIYRVQTHHDKRHERLICYSIDFVLESTFNCDYALVVTSTGLSSDG